MNENNKLTRALGMKEAITMTCGTVIGVGIFTVGSQTVGTMQSGVILCTLAAMLICVMPVMMYSEMGAAMPYAGGTYQFAKNGINKPIASIGAWHYLVALIAGVAGESLAFSNYFTYILEELGVGYVPDSRVIAIILIAFFTFVNVRGIQISGRVQNGFVGFFWAASIIWMIYMIQHVELSHFLPRAIVEIPGIQTWLVCVVYIWWCFAGFETAVNMGGEIKYPHIVIPRALKIALCLVFVVNALFQYFLTAIVPLDRIAEIATSDAPYAAGMRIAGYVGFPMIFLCIGITFGGDLSTMNPGVASCSRYIYEMGQDHVFPPAVGKVHKKFRTPYIAVIIVGAIALLLLLTGSITFIAEVSVTSLFWCYIIGFIAFIRLRLRHPEMKRPYKTKVGIPGAVISIAIYCVMIWALGLYYFLLSLGIAGVCLLVYVLYSRRHVEDQKTFEERVFKEIDETVMEEPTEAERKKMDREYKIWSVLAAALFVFVLVVWIVSFAL